MISCYVTDSWLLFNIAKLNFLGLFMLSISPSSKVPTTTFKKSDFAIFYWNVLFSLLPVFFTLHHLGEQISSWYVRGSGGNYWGARRRKSDLNHNIFNKLYFCCHSVQNKLDLDLFYLNVQKWLLFFLYIVLVLKPLLVLLWCPLTVSLFGKDVDCLFFASDW